MESISDVATGTAIALIIRSNTLWLDGYWHVERNGQKIETTTIDDRFGYDYLANIGGTTHLLHPGDIPFIQTIINQKQSAAASIRFRIVNANNEVKFVYGIGHVRISQRGFQNESDTEIKNSIERKELLKAVFNTSTLGLHVLRSIRNEAGVIVDFEIILTNSTSERIAGKKVMGMKMLEGWPHTRDIGLFQKFIETVETGKPLIYEHVYEGDGVTAWFEWLATRLEDGLYVTIEDITRRKKNEVALKHTANRLQSTFDGVPAIIALLDVVEDSNRIPVDFIICAANKALSDFTGCETEDLIGKSIIQLYPEVFRGQLWDKYAQVYITGISLQHELLYPGRNRWFSVSISKQVGGEGLVVAALEITAQKKNEAQRKQNQILTELNEAKTKFFSNVSHEFRTPLTLMLGPLHQLLKKYEDAPRHDEDLAKLQMIMRNSLRLEKLVNSLLDFTRMEAGRAEAVFQPTDIAEFTTLLAGNFRSAIERAGLAYTVNCHSTEPIYLNHDMWEKIVLNLLSNAFKFTFEGKIEIILKSLKNQVQLHVRDTGVGIAQENLSRIFERFVTIHNVRSRTYEGTGIGLALIKEFVKMHGGDIKVKSKEGRGSIFIVSLPKGKAHLAPQCIFENREIKGVSPLSAVYGYEAMNWMFNHRKESDSETASALRDESGCLKQSPNLILIIDDNSDLQEYIKSILKKDYSVACARNGRNAVELIAKGLLPDLIVADIMMPEMDGYSLLHSVRTNERLAHVPFIFLSAKASPEDRIKGMDSGADDYLIKPFSSAELLTRIKARLKTKGALAV